MAFKWRWDLVTLGALSLIFFVLSSLLMFENATTFNSPDENANAAFVNEFALRSRLYFDEPLNVELHNLLHPRSVVAFGGRLLPVSFLGLPMVFGLLGKVVGVPLVGLLTPLLAVLAIFAWRAMVERLFASRLLAFFAAIAVVFHPAFWHYSGRLFMHNVPFTASLILAVYFAIRVPSRFHYFASGLFLALALWFRTSEIFWVAPLTVGLLFAARRQRGKTFLILPLTAVILLAPMLYVNTLLYGDPLTTGYTLNNTEAMIEAQPTGAEESGATTLLPFDLDLSAIPRNVYHYAFELYPWLTTPAFLGALIFLAKASRKAGTERRIYRAYLLVASGVTAWLFTFYGSWSFTDNPNPSLQTIGTSYVRYWLPVFVLWSPFVGQFMCWVVHRMKTVFTRRAMIGFLTLLVMGLSVRPTFFAEDGLARIRESVAASSAKRARVLELTGEDAIIIVDRADKFLWPSRRVVVPLRAEETYAAMPALFTRADLYYFGITLPEEDLQYLNTQKLGQLDLQIERVETMGDETLYRMTQPEEILWD